MKPLKLDALRAALPDLDELRPLLDRIVAESRPDPAHVWSASGAVETVGGRLVSGDPVEDRAAALAEEARRSLETIYRRVGRAVDRLREGDAAGACEALLAAAAAEEERGSFDRADAYARAAYRLVEDTADRLLSARALRRAARAAWRRGRLAVALTRYRDAVELAQVAKDPRGAAEAAVGAGNVLEEQGRWHEAEGWYRRALDLLESVGEPTSERWHAELDLHIAMRSRGAVDESEPWLERAARTAEALGEEARARPFVENARGQLAMARSALDDAERHFDEALSTASGARARVTIRLNLAECLLARGRTLEAAEACREAELEAVRAAQVARLPEVYRLLGRIAAAAGDPEAFVLFERSLEIVRERGLPVLEEARTLQAYAEYERGRGERESAETLADRARRRFRSLGIAGPRHPWADTHVDERADGPTPGGAGPDAGTQDESRDAGKADP